MKSIFSLFYLIFFISLGSTVIGQKVLDKGSIKMEITKVSAEDPQMAMGLEMMKGSKTEVFFKDDQYVTYMDMMGGMLKMQVHVEKGKNTMNMLMDMMGNKSWIESKLDETQTVQQKEIANQSKIEYDKNDTKEILGYKCYKMTVTNPEMDGMTVTGYVTEDIKTKANLIQGFQSLEFAGYTMEFTVGNPKFSMTMTAIDIKDQIDDSKFSFDTKGYKKMTMAEFQKSMGGMGGFGF
ncbi:MAG: hypothetical protein IPL55_23280 [Saprospiraceae bacterium]|jgi:hypothetical protein|nr:hypothetical protein [Saprospiraceae bacterium]MBL0025359.1 hypothetical protein [Saprospiraceae bacterium]